MEDMRLGVEWDEMLDSRDHWGGIKFLFYKYPGGKEYLREFCGEWNTSIGEAHKLISTSSEFKEAAEWLYQSLIEREEKKKIISFNQKVIKTKPKWNVVRHPVFGFGRVISIEGDREKVIAYFPGHGEKKIITAAVPGGMKFIINKCNCGKFIGPTATRCQRCTVAHQRGHVENLTRCKPRSEWLRTLAPIQ
jgi:hypothetical protein